MLEKRVQELLAKKPSAAAGETEAEAEADVAAIAGTSSRTTAELEKENASLNERCPTYSMMYIYISLQAEVPDASALLSCGAFEIEGHSDTSISVYR